MVHKTNFYWLDLLRGLAAILVFLSHIRVLYLLDFPDVEHHAGATLLYFVTGFGHSSVIIFFVLSGFFIVRSIDRAVDSGRWSTGLYLIDRLSRLWVVLVPALLFTVLLDQWGTTLFPNALAYRGAIDSLKEVNPDGKSDLETFLGNLVFLQTIRVPTFGSNTPLWSLAYEFWYYLTFPMMYFAVRERGRPAQRIAYALASVGLLFFVGRSIAQYYPIWLMGGVTYFLYKTNRWHWLGRLPYLLGATALVVVTLTLIRLGRYPALFNSYTLGIAMALLTLSLTQVDMKGAFAQRVAQFLSNISYTLYLVHMPLSIFLTSALIQQRQPLTGSTFLILSGLCVGVIAFSYGFWYLFERQTPRVREWAKTKLLVSRPPVRELENPDSQQVH